MDNECKAWESNVDATYEGNPIGGCAPDNWGSCGFQRHFPWRILTATETTALSLDGFTQMDITLAGAPTATAFDSGNVGGSVEVATEYNLGGRPFLGGMCKLFVPVARANIVQVQIAGVHKQGPSYAQYPAKTVTTGADIEGTAYCFSVANVAETRDNTNAIANGNVAGEGQASPLVNTGRTDLFTGLNSLERQVGVSYGITYGATLTASLGTDEAGEVKAGNNFDVVAHFDDTFCETNWGQPTICKWPVMREQAHWTTPSIRLLASHTPTPISWTSVTMRLVTVDFTPFQTPTTWHVMLLVVRPPSTTSAGQTPVPGPVSTHTSCASTQVSHLGWVPTSGARLNVQWPCPSPPPTTVLILMLLAPRSSPTSASISVKSVATLSCAAPANCPMATPTSVARGIGITMPRPISVPATQMIPRVSSIAQSR